MNTSSTQIVTTVTPSTSLEWAVDTLCDGEAVSYATALTACAELGSGWRLPTIEEKLTQVRYDRIGPAIDTALFPDTALGAYWTSTVHAFSDTDVWVVDLFSGATGNYRKEGNFAYVRAVRTVEPSEGEEA
ncbi:DUF1566 domain-containing protein [Lysobacter sp. Root96]|uniref:Lcl C-terminal domain-containing protein n=1 Tax=Lysobacter sp. Root96 TaxID=1736612 RepID=UPI0006FA3EE0|nr:DUF1566 domain-containing protein [Lysobacter sp. Root96]KRD71396.1 hypothetical protein ASE45_06190 [Lysobacter sp. Root96]